MRPNFQRAQNAKKALIIVLIGLVITTIASVILLSMLSDSYAYGEIRNDILTASMVVGLIALLQLAAYITCMVLFIMWFRRAYFNLHMLVPSSKLKYSEGWASGAWFIPIFNLFGPYQIANDLFVESEKLLVENNLMERNESFHQVKGWWWGLWIASSVLNQIDSNMSDNVELSTSIVLSFIVLLVTLGSGILAIKMIDNYTQMEELLKQLPQDTTEAPTIQITNDDLLDSGI